MSTKPGYFLILILLLAAFALRLGHLLAGIFHIDEYISMLAAQMTAQKGAPFLPSGLLYHQGLLLSYLAAPLITWTGFREEIARWPSLLAGVLAVAAFYQVGRRTLRTSFAGLLALTLATFDPEMILWSARMRMYALASLLMLLGFYFLLQGVLLHPHRFGRLLGVALYLAAILTHSVAVVALPVWSLALLIGLWLGQRKFKFDWYRQKPVILELIIAGVLLAVGAAFAVGGQIPFLSPDAAGGGSSGNGDGSGLAGVFNKFLDPGFSWQRVDDFIYVYTAAEYWPLLILAALSFGLALLAVIRGRLTRRDLAVICLGLVFLLTIAELGLALTSTWRKTRYLFILCHPPFLLLAADGLARVFEKLPRLLTSRPPATDRRERSLPLGPPQGIPLLPTIYFLLPVFLIVAYWASPALSVAMARGTGGYHTIFKWVESQWQEGDRVMTVHPSAAYLYLGRSDYYATQGTARVFADDESEELVDRYVGSTLVDSVEGLDKVLAESPRLWFVVDNNRLFSRYEPLFIQQVFAQMNVQRQDSGVLVFLSQPYPRPIPAEPLAELHANFSDLIELGGYSLDLAAATPDRTVQLALYWRPKTSQIRKPYKVFVQLRDGQNQTVAQADHFIYEGLLSGGTLGQLKDQGEWLRDSADLALPENLPPGAYRLFAGLYDPATLERVPLVADSSGENAVLLETISNP
ncbi:MAG: glycosyltransferase family 39 protein [Anaerolineales bacterium]|nr:glycosyltransferase family 39 protein [Anaerolineales bacterium]